MGMRKKEEIMPVENSLPTVDRAGANADHTNIMISAELLADIRQCVAMCTVYLNAMEGNDLLGPIPGYLQNVAEGK